MRGMSRFGMLTALAFLVLALAAPASADLVTYSTTGTFSASGTNVVTSGGNSITFTGVANVVVSPPPTVGPFGTFTTVNPTAFTPGGTFQLDISQTTPGVGAGSSTGSLTGTVGPGPTGFLTLDFTGNNSVVIASVTYTLQNQYLIGPNSVNTFNMLISNVPEPSFYALTASLFLGLVFFAWKRFRNA